MDINDKKANVEELMIDLLELSLLDLKKKISSGEAEAKDLEVLRKLLLDNNVNINVNKSKAASVLTNLPFETDEIERYS